MSMASMNALPMMPKMVSTPWATIVSTNASLGVMRVMSATSIGQFARSRAASGC